MANYAVDVDITMSKRIEVEADNSEDAKNIVKNWLADDPYYYARSADAYVSNEITDVNEEED